MNQIDKSRESIGAQNTYESINSGCLQRIATAVETMSRSYVHLQNDRDSYKASYLRKSKSASALRGQITKLKKAMKAAN